MLITCHFFREILLFSSAEFQAIRCQRFASHAVETLDEQFPRKEKLLRSSVTCNPRLDVSFFEELWLCQSSVATHAPGPSKKVSRSSACIDVISSKVQREIRLEKKGAMLHICCHIFQYQYMISPSFCYMYCKSVYGV